ncbi:MAG: isocitrate/isopropylmalate family dehydrogenase [Firmicutes bacterium]|nr:isocitrate/isopropylmalate family dehydrogenase [Bacillota bacterium]MCL5039702.1 isocitrate/isopropylmalate family dehydrogenase [Bacillota bacterium]
MAHRVTLITGDGIGREVVPAAQKVVEATGVAVQWEEMPAGEMAAEKLGEAVPEETIASIIRNKVALKGPLTNLVARGWASPNVTLRSKLGLFAQVRRVRHFDGVPSPYRGVDLIVVREAVEDTYAGVEQKVGPDAAVAIKFATRAASEQVARFTMEYARRLGRRKVTVAHKANILKLTDGLFLESARKVAAEFPDLEFNDRMIDNMCFQLVRAPLDYDLILTTNVYGDILADLTAGLVGSLGLGFGGNFGHAVALFEPVHGTAPNKAGRGISNPIGEILTASMMLAHLGETAAAMAIERAVERVLKEGKVLTADLGGRATTAEMTGAIIAALNQP